jgi:hypothetical protein
MYIFVRPEYDSPRLARRQLVEMKRDRQLLELERRHFAGLRVEPQCAYFDCNIGDVDPFTSQSAGWLVPPHVLFLF